MTKLTKAMIARRRVENAKNTLDEVMRKTYPAGTQTSYRRGQTWVPCEVVACHGDIVKVRSDSGKEYTINGFRLRGASDMYG